MESSASDPNLSLLASAASTLGLGVGTLDASGELVCALGALRQIAAAWGEPAAWWRHAQRALKERFGTATPQVLQSRAVSVELTDPEGRRRVFELAIARADERVIVLARDLTADTLDHERLEATCRELRDDLHRANDREHAQSAFLGQTLSQLRAPLQLLGERCAAPLTEERAAQVHRDLLGTVRALETQVESESARRHLSEQIDLLSRSMSATLDLGHVFEALLDAAFEVLSYEHAAAWVRRDGRFIRVSQRGTPRLTAEIIDPASDEPLARLASSPSPLRALDPRGDADLSWIAERGIGAWFGVPLHHDGECVGLLALESSSAARWTELRLQACLEMATHAGAAINNARRFAEVHRLSVMDELTGVANRRHFTEVAHREFRRALERGRPVSAIMLDVDFFKRVNDTWGHHVGDEVLREIAQRCLRALRDEDLFGRYGGEEFVVLLPETSKEHAATSVAERLRLLVASPPITTSHAHLEITISLGVAQALPGDKLADLIERADLALLDAKQRGRNCVALSPS